MDKGSMNHSREAALLSAKRRHGVFITEEQQKTHICSGATCRLLFFSRGQDLESALVASGDVFVCERYGTVHLCTQRACDAGVEHMHAHVCRITGRERRVLYNYTLGASAKHSGDTFERSGTSARVLAQGAEATSFSDKRRRLRETPFTYPFTEPSTNTSSKHKTNVTEERLENTQLVRGRDRLEKARQLVHALLCSEHASTLRERRQTLALDEADRCAAIALAQRRSLIHAATAFLGCYTEEQLQLRSWPLPRQQLDVNMITYYARACTLTWERACRSPLAKDIEAKTHPSFKKHCLGLLYALHSGIYVKITVSSEDHACIERALSMDLALVARNDEIARLLPAYADLDALLKSAQLGCDKTAAREGSNMMRECYASIVVALRYALRAALNRAEVETLETANTTNTSSLSKAILTAVTAFFEEVRNLSFERVVGPLPLPFIAL
jgi:hypothetical protein